MRWPGRFGSVASRDPAPASLAQERIWRLCASPAAEAGYTIATAQTILGPLDLGIIKRATEYLIARHEALRTTFREQEGALLQVVHPPAEIAMPLLDARMAEDPRARADALLRELAAPAFDLERGPLLRVQVVRVGEEEHMMHRAHHHIISDGASWVMFSNELAVVYQGLLAGEEAPLGAPPAVSSAEIAIRERSRTRSHRRRHRELLARWRDLAEVEATAPPFERPVPLVDVRATEGTISWVLAPEISAGLERLRAAAGVTYYTVRLAIFAAALAMEAEVEEALIGTYVSTRRTPESKRMFGCFTHLAPLRLALPGAMGVAPWLASVRDAVTEAKDIAADLPYEVVAEELRAQGVELPGIRALFSLYQPQPAVRFDEMDISAAIPLRDRCMPSGFSFIVNRATASEPYHVDFDANVYDPTRVRAFIERYQHLAVELSDA